MKLPRIIKLSLLIALFLLLLMSLFRLGLYWYFPKPAGHHTAVLRAFILGSRYDLRDVCILLLPLLVLGSTRKFSPFESNRARKYWKFYFVFFTMIALLFYMMDLSYYDYLQQRLNAQVLNFLQDAAISFNMMWQSYPIIKMLLLIIVLTWLVAKLFDYFFRKVNTTWVGPSKRNKTISFIIAFLLLALGIFGRVGQYPLRWSDAFNFGDDYLAAVSLNPFQSFFSSLKFRDASFDIKKAKLYYNDMASWLGVDKPDSNALNYERNIHDTTSLLSFSQPPNVVLVICESFSAYKTSMWGNPLNSTPYFAEMCRNGYFFDHCFTSQWGTARGIWACITGVPDVQEGNTASRNPGAVDQHSIISDFKGYEKFYFMGGDASWANVRGLLKNNIDSLRMYEQDDFKAAKVDVWGVSDKNLFLETNKILAQQQKPFIAVIQTADNHRPYTIPSEDLQEFKKVSLPNDTLHKYGFDDNAEYNAFRYSDFCFQKFIEAAQKEKYFSNTIFIFVGDHGNPGNASATFPDAWTKQGLVYNHVPLLFYAPGRLAPKRTSTLSSQQDILSSVASLCKISYRNTTLGRNLFHIDTLQPKTDLAFVHSYSDRGYGLVEGDHFFKWDYATKRENLFSMLSNEALPANAKTDSVKKRMSYWANAYYETAKYMLYNNKKKAIRNKQ